jgi:2-oxoglutarate dehydrogenase complex dehydrogenase (E1) component-like enzyme
MAYFTNVLGKSLVASLAELRGAPSIPVDNRHRTGDVPFHLGHSATIEVGRKKQQLKVF